MDQLIPITNQIQDALASVDLDLGVELPQIAVVGGQSAGKSSLLEAFVGHAFLPTGQGVVTRRPLVLRLANTRRDQSEAEWGEFQHLPGKRFEDFDQIRREIELDTERVCGQQQAVSSEPIVLKISSPKVIDLTLIDLPGMTRVPVGDQPEDIEKQIRELVMTYVTKPSCLILAVVPGNVDLATADALAVARQVDPDGHRTIGVITKLDLVENGSDVLSVLEGRVYPLRHGFVGVVCRSLRDVQKGKALQDQLQAEAQFFRGHAAYKAIAQRSGMAHLAKHLNRIFLEHICSALPKVTAQVRQMIHENEVELQGYGETMSLQRAEQGPLLLGLLTKFAGRFGDAIEGKFSGELEFASGQLVGRARIDYIFRDVFARTVRDFDACSGLSDDEIRVAIRNATGPRATLFVPEAAFEQLAKKQIAKLQVPSLQCADLVFEELHRVLMLSALPEFRRFADLRDEVFGVVRDILQRSLEPTVQMIKDLVSIELAYINTTHPDFIGSSGAMRAALGPQEPPRGHVVPSAQSQNGAAAPVAVGNGTSMGVGATAPVAAAPDRSSVPAATEDSTTMGPPAGIGGRLFSFFRGQPGRKGYSPREASGDATCDEVASPAAPQVAVMGSVPARGLGRADELDGIAVAPTVAAGVGACGNGANTASFGFGGTMRSRVSSTGSSGGPVGASVLKLQALPPAISPATLAPTQRERLEVGIIKTLMDSYLLLVKKNVADSVPKAVMYFMVNTLKDVIQSECVARLYKEERFDELLREATDVQGRRARCQQRLGALHKVIEVAEQVREYVDVW